MKEWITVEKGDGVAVVRLNRPPVNALNMEFLKILRASILDSAADRDVGAVVVTGTGKAFAAGGDIDLLNNLDETSFRDYVRTMQQSWDEIEAAPVPTIAAINGFALGGGFELALSCDLRIASANAKVGLPEVQLGLFPAAGGSTRLARVVGKGRALEILWSYRSVDAAEAFDLKLVEKVTAPDELMSEAVGLAKRLAAGPRAAIAATKRSVLAGLDGGPRAQFRSEIREVEALFGTPDNIEGVTAFLAKRKPVFSGSK